MDHYIVSARKYRPATFASVVGQKALTATLKNAIATGRLAHSYLFCGSRGVGKTSCARIFAKTINCENITPDGEACNECESCRSFNEGNSLNIIELDAASNNGVDDIRQLVEQVQIPPSRGQYRVFIVDEVHMLSAAAFNAFLKTLEEPPSYVIFILATTEKHKIIPTILSRCQIYDFNRISIRDIIDHLAYVAKSEGMTAEPAALNVIARKADGAMRDALSIFDQVAASSRGNITFQATIDNLNVLDFHYYNRLLEAFLAGDVLQSWMIYKEIRDRGFDSHFFINGLADYMRDLMVARDPATIVLLEADDEARAEMAATAAKCQPAFILKAMSLCNEADLNYRTAANKQFLTELTLAKICQSAGPSPSNGGNGEGQLKPIAARQAPESAPAPAPQQPQAAPQAAPAPAASKPVNLPPPPRRAPAPAPRSAAPAGMPRTFSISGGNRTGADTAPAEVPGAATAPQTVREASYTPEQFLGAWKEYIVQHPKEQILINTMRAGQPKAVSADTYVMTVENEMQQAVMAEAMASVLTHLRNSLSNDRITLSVVMNKGESSPLTWNEREVLSHMVENMPVLRDFIADFKLTIG